jgi:cobalamin biosynthesis protein CobT
MGNEQAYSFKKKNDLAWNDKVPLEKIAPMALLCNGRKNMGYFGFNIGDIRSHVEEKDRLDEWTDRIFECGNTKEAFELAEEIYIEIMNGAKEEDDPKFNMMPSPENIIAQEIADELATSKVKDGTYPYKIYTKDNDRVHHWSDTAPTVVSEEELKNSVRRYAGAEMRKLGNISAYMKKAESLGSTINIARRRLEMMIAAQRRTEWDYTKEQGKFDSKRMTSAMAGSTDVFKTKENAADIDTAISVVIDLSGSMNNDGKRPVATDTAIVLFECLSKIGIPFEVIGFDANFSAVDKHESDRIERLFQECRSSSTAEDKRLARFEGLHTYVFKSFRDRPFDARPYIMGLSTGGVGGRNNCDGESVLLAHERLLARPEKRKIMFVLSDGHPECHCYSGEQQVTYMKKAVAQIEKKGTHIVGIGIMTDAVKSYYPKSIVVHDPKDLAGETLKVLSGLLIEKKKK